MEQKPPVKQANPADKPVPKTIVDPTPKQLDTLKPEEKAMFKDFETKAEKSPAYPTDKDKSGEDTVTSVPVAEYVPPPDIPQEVPLGEGSDPMYLKTPPDDKVRLHPESEDTEPEVETKK